MKDSTESLLVRCAPVISVVVAIVMAIVALSGCVPNRGPGYASTTLGHTISANTDAMREATRIAIDGWNEQCPGLFIGVSYLTGVESEVVVIGSDMGTAGRVSYQSGRALIISQNLLPEVQPTFVAHELGHFLLGKLHETRPGVFSVRRANYVADSEDPTPMSRMPTWADREALLAAGFKCGAVR